MRGTGVQYLLLGVLFGPLLGWVDSRWIAPLHPVFTLATGLLGFSVGLHLQARRWVGLERSALLAAGWVCVGTSLLVLGTTVALVVSIAGVAELWRWMPPLLAVTAVALVAELGQLRGLISVAGGRGPATDFLARVSRYCNAIALLVSGVTFCVYRPHSDAFGWTLSGLHWFAVEVGLGVLLGLVFALFRWKSRDLDEIRGLAVLLGITALGSGIAMVLMLSPLLLCMVAGATFANTSRHAVPVEALLGRLEGTVRTVLFLAAGVAWLPGARWWGYVLFVPFIVLRALGRRLGGRLAAGSVASAGRFPPLGRALMASEALSVAIVLSHHDVYGARLLGAEIYTGLLVAIIIGEVVAYRSTRSWLIDASATSAADRTSPVGGASILTSRATTRSGNA